MPYAMARSFREAAAPCPRATISTAERQRSAQASDARRRLGGRGLRLADRPAALDPLRLAAADADQRALDDAVQPVRERDRERDPDGEVDQLRQQAAGCDQRGGKRER